MTALKVVLGFALLAVVSSYKKGPPVDDPDHNVCSDMTPDHGPNNGGAPRHELKVSQDCFNKDTKLQVKIAKKSGATDTRIEGFFMQARSTSETQANSKGKFDGLKTKHVGLYNCFSGTGNAIGHHEDEVTGDELIVQWTPDNNLRDDIKFNTTVVRTKDKYWMGIVSDTVRYRADCEQMELFTDKAHPLNGLSSLVLCLLALMVVLVIQ